MRRLDRVRVLLVEDDDLYARLMQTTLAAAADVDFDIEHVDCLESALRRLRDGVFDIVMLDLNLPDSQGVGTVESVRMSNLNVPIVVLTGLDQRDVGLSAIERGAQDYLLKGSLDSELIVRSLLYALQRKRIEETDIELAAARSIQRQLMPASAPSLPGFDIAGVCYPATVASGDYFDFVPLPDGTLGLIVGDVSGHGVGPALMMVNTRAYIRSFSQSQTDPRKILSEVNRLLYDETPESLFITLFFARLDTKRRILEYAGAGHVAYHLCGENNYADQLLPSTALPLAVDTQWICRVSEPVSMKAGDIVLLLSDGFHETRSLDQSLFGMQRILEVVRRNAHRAAQEIGELIHREARAFAGGRPQTDDATGVVVKVCA